MQSTRITLLQRLADGGSEADWEVFFDIYQDIIVGFARSKGLSPSDAEDLLQETMVDLMRGLQRFQYDREKGLFRSYLKTIVARKVARFYQAKTRTPDLVSIDAESSDRDNLADRLGVADPDTFSEEDETLWRRSVVEHCLRCLLEETGLDEQTVAIFRALALDGGRVPDVAQQFGLAPNAVHQIRHRMLHRLQAAVQELTGEDGEQP